MIRFTLIYIYLSITSLSYSQGWFQVSGGTVNVQEGLTVFKDISVNNNDKLIYNINTNALFQSDNSLTIEGDSTIEFYHITLSADLIQQNEIVLHGNLYFSEGIYDLGNHNLFLHGDLINENNSTYITSNGSGEIIRKVDLVQGINQTPGNLGLEITPSEHGNTLLHRGHLQHFNTYDESINRYFRFTGNLPKAEKLVFHYLDHEIGSHTEENLVLWFQESGNWRETGFERFEPMLNQISQLPGKQLESITLFPQVFYGSVIIPEGFSPSNDNVNEYFVIEGIENFPENRLVVFNQWGEIVFEAYAYDNTWNGEMKRNDAILKSEKINSGTYFYIFYKRQDDPNPIKGVVEIKTGS